jgi:hypothetical protein
MEHDSHGRNREIVQIVRNTVMIVLQDRSVESESGETNMASVMNSLKKIVKAINPK